MGVYVFLDSFSFTLDRNGKRIWIGIFCLAAVRWILGRLPLIMPDHSSSSWISPTTSATSRSQLTSRAASTSLCSGRLWMPSRVMTATGFVTIMQPPEADSRQPPPPLARLPRPSPGFSCLFFRERGRGSNCIVNSNARGPLCVTYTCARSQQACSRRTREVSIVSFLVESDAGAVSQLQSAV